VDESGKAQLCRHPPASAIDRHHLADHLRGGDWRIAPRLRVAAHHERGNRTLGHLDVDHPVRDRALLIAIQQDVAAPDAGQLDPGDRDRVAVGDCRLHARAVRAEAHTVAFIKQVFGDLEQPHAGPIREGSRAPSDRARRRARRRGPAG
jgi:hypothetical protein